MADRPFFEQLTDDLDFKMGIVPFVLMLILSIAGWGLVFANPHAALLLFYIGTFIGVGLGFYLMLPDKRRNLGRRIMLLMMGSLLLVLAFVTRHGNMQIEGLIFALLTGTGGFIVLHYLLAKIVGPFVIGRVWCGWACWFAMIFDQFPYPYSRYRIPGRWTWLRYAHLGLSVCLVVGLVYGFGYRGGGMGDAWWLWFALGLAAYYALGIGLALVLKDNRAFCKYACPIAPLMKVGSKVAVLRVAGDATDCGECIACMEMCPMNIDIKAYLLHGERVQSTECTLCQTCINVCPNDSLWLSLALDGAGVERIDYEPPKRRR